MLTIFVQTKAASEPAFPGVHPTELQQFVSHGIASLPASQPLPGCLPVAVNVSASVSVTVRRDMCKRLAYLFYVVGRSLVVVVVVWELDFLRANWPRKYVEKRCENFVARHSANVFYSILALILMHLHMCIAFNRRLAVVAVGAMGDSIFLVSQLEFHAASKRADAVYSKQQQHQNSG